MAKFTVSIEECVVCDFKYEADNADEAYEKAYDDYRHQRIIVDGASGAQTYWASIRTIDEEGFEIEHYCGNI